MTVQNHAWLAPTAATNGASAAPRQDSIESPGRFAALLDRAQDAPARSRDSALGNAFEVREAQRPAAARQGANAPEAAPAAPTARQADPASRAAATASRPTTSERAREPQRTKAERASSQRSDSAADKTSEQPATQASAATEAGEQAATAKTAAADAAMPGLLAAPDAGSTDVLTWLERLATQAAPDDTAADAGIAAAAKGDAAAASALPPVLAQAGPDLGAATETMAATMLAGIAVPAAAGESAAASSPALRIDAAGLPGLASAPVATTHQGSESAAAPREAHIAAPTDSPEFPQVLAGQISTFARDGVQEAQLSLNPAEMGPVSVRIVVDGKDAQVAFHATQAATRSALEASLPTLAASLQEAGLTLSGGGVFDQGPQQQPGDRQGGGGRRFGASSADTGEDIAAAGRAARHAQPRGLLDLYA